MSSYELCLVVNAKVEDDVRNASVEDAKNLITRFGGEIKDVEEWGKKRLAYEVQKMNEGYYYFIHFDAETTAPAEVEDRLRTRDNVLRFLCTKIEA
ncbi:MAG: 30S ribosomal protein S6 [Lachnospiraceae bacterium]|nr:30S ribosomal protein S6 [Lachnospiraceae bacterium]